MWSIPNAQGKRCYHKLCLVRNHNRMMLGCRRNKSAKAVTAATVWMIRGEWESELVRLYNSTQLILISWWCVCDFSSLMELTWCSAGSLSSTTHIPLHRLFTSCDCIKLSTAFCLLHCCYIFVCLCTFVIVNLLLTGSSCAYLCRQVQETFQIFSKLWESRV